MYTNIVARALGELSKRVLAKTKKNATFFTADPHFEKKTIQIGGGSVKLLLW